MNLTKDILDLARELEVEYKLMISGVEDIFEIDGNPFYLKAVANEMMKAAMTSLTLKKDYHMKLVGLRNDFLDGNIDVEKFCMEVLLGFEKEAYSPEDNTEGLLKVYSMMKKGADLEIMIFGDNKASELMNNYSEKIYGMLLTTLPQDKKFLESNGVVEDLFEDFVLDKIGYAELLQSINDFYIDWADRKANAKVNATINLYN